VWVWNGQWKRPFGTAAEYIALPQEQAVPLPENITFEEGVRLGVPALPALRALSTDGSVLGNTVLITGGAGAVGAYAIQLARLLGAAKTISTVSSAEKARIAEGYGADHVINHRTEDVAHRIKELTDGKGVDRIVEVDAAAKIPFAFGPMIAIGAAVRFFVIYGLVPAVRERTVGALNIIFARVSPEAHPGTNLPTRRCRRGARSRRKRERGPEHRGMIMQRQIFQHRRASHETGTKQRLERTMREIGYQQTGAIDRSEALVDIELPTPEPRTEDFPDEVRAVLTNPVDFKIRSSAALEAGQWKVVGWDAAGTVRAAGSGVTLFHAGDAMFYAGTVGRAGTPKRWRIGCGMRPTARLFPAIRLLVAMLLTSVGALAQQPAPPGMSLATAAAKRFPQPVRVGDLIGRTGNRGRFPGNQAVVAAWRTRSGSGGMLTMPGTCRRSPR